MFIQTLDLLLHFLQNCLVFDCLGRSIMMISILFENTLELLLVKRLFVFLFSILFLQSFLHAVKGRGQIELIGWSFWLQGSDTSKLLSNIVILIDVSQMF